MKSQRPKRDESGFVMVTVVIVLIAILLPLVIITQTSQVASLLTAGRARNYALARNAATSLYSTIYEQANTTTEPFSSCAYRSWPGYAGPMSCPPPASVPAPSWPRSWTTRSVRSPRHHFVAFGASGALSTCSEPSKPCADFVVAYQPSSSSSSSSAPFADVVVQAFDGCGGASSLCVEVRYLAQMFRETYTNWLWFNSHTTIGGPNAPQPGGFLTPPTSFYQKTGIWTTAQVANGPVGTNGTNIYYCGSPTFNGSITALSNPPLTQSTGCTDPPLTATSSPPMPPTGMPPPGDLPPTTALNTLQAIAADEPCTPSPAIGLFCYGPSPHPYDLTGNNDIRLYPSTRPGYSLISITGASGSATVQWPSHRLLYDSGDLTVTSTPNYAPGNVPSITLAASGDVVIQGNLQVPLNEPTPASGCIYPVSGIGKAFMTPSDSCTGIIGIIAGRNIILSPNSNAAGHYADQSVDAVLFALSGAVYDEAWDVPAASCGSLYFVGSIIEDYQGLFGTGAQGTAGVTTGYQTNNFYYDTRLEDPQLQPPHFFLPAASQWQSLSLAEVPSQ